MNHSDRNPVLEKFHRTLFVVVCFLVMSQLMVPEEGWATNPWNHHPHWGDATSAWSSKPPASARVKNRVHGEFHHPSRGFRFWGRPGANQLSVLGRLRVLEELQESRSDVIFVDSPLRFHPVGSLRWSNHRRLLFWNDLQPRGLRWQFLSLEVRD